MTTLEAILTGGGMAVSILLPYSTILYLLCPKKDKRWYGTMLVIIGTLAFLNLGWTAHGAYKAHQGVEQAEKRIEQRKEMLKERLKWSQY